MTTSIKTKSVTASAAIAVPVPSNNPTTLTVVVVDSKGQPAPGAHVSMMPSGQSGTTNVAGEVQFQLGSATKYDITATFGSSTVTVPYYVTKNGATRLVVNPVYVKSVEQKLHPSLFSGMPIGNIVIGAGVLVFVILVWKFLRRKKRRKSK
jgi:hypothetical protein